ncbi:Fic family protein [Mycolicibacterium sp. 120266]|uniref:Fic/DOC family protein n=1 Tax=Mycolicibacterium sp. 120266 TaxID=3090601 RepID=UPI00299DF6AE|nr:Fic family protein [Mycolicibacterium sp. 120266]MDX1874635.1 Fic family protein [Mycolicibacterium sp. 120266]
MRRALDQTVAAQRLEGWQPTGPQLADLARLAAAELSFGEYLAGHRDRYPPAQPPPRRWVLRRRIPYVIPGTAVLRNNFGLGDAVALTELECIATAGRMLAWHLRIAAGRTGPADLDARVIHQQLFADVYAWAGRYRVTELRRGETAFGWQADIAARMAEVTDRARGLVTTPPGDGPALVYQLSRLYADYNQVHPFREGNGRTGTLLLHTVSALCGYRLDLSGISRADWYAASADSMPFRRDGRANHRPFIPLLMRAVGR